MMDSLLLLFAARISKRQVKRKRIFLGGSGRIPSDLSGHSASYTVRGA